MGKSISQAIIFRNLVGLSTVTALWVGWLFRYTDWFPLVGGFLTLTGSFAWAALLFQLMTEDRLDGLRREFERVVLLRRGLWKLLFASVLALLVLASVTTTVEVSSLRDSEDRAVSVYRKSSGKLIGLREAPLAARSKKRFIFIGKKELQVKVSGLPARDFVPSRFGVRPLMVPDDFVRRVLLIRPTKTLSEIGRAVDSLTLNVWVNEEKIIDALPFVGRAVWVGCDSDVDIPIEISSRWINEGSWPWMPPVSAGREFPHSPGDRVLVSLEAPHEQYSEEMTGPILPATGIGDFVEEVILSEPSQ